MANYLYVKSGGTATGTGGKYGTMKTGSWATAFSAASQYYDSLNDAYNQGAIAAGDFVLISSASAKTGLANISFLPNSPTNVLTVSDSAVDTAAVASSVQETTTSTVTLGAGGVNCYGVYVETTAAQLYLTGYSGYNVYRNCTFANTSSYISLGAYGFTNYQGAVTELINCTLRYNTANMTTPLRIGGNSYVIMRGGRIYSNTGTITTLWGSGFDYGGATVRFYGVDLSDVATNILNTDMSGTDIGNVDIELHRCQLASTPPAFVNAGVTFKWSHRMGVYNCSGSGTNAEYQYYYRQEQCIAESDTSFYRTAGIGFPETGQKVSIKCTTSANATGLRPFIFRLPAQYANLATAASDTLRIYLVSSDSALTNKDVWAELVYPDGTSKYVSNFLSTMNTNPLGAGTALSSDTSDWYGRTTQTRYYIDVNTSGTAGSGGVPILRLAVAKASTTIYFATSVDLV